jgi:hypothetical protein
VSRYFPLIVDVPPVIERRLKIAIILFLSIALVEDSLLALMSWLAPQLWFLLFHGATTTGLAIAFLRRSGGQWIAFALAQAITLWRWKKNPVWLAVAAGVRFSDLFTDLSYILAVPSLTRLGWICLLPPSLLNLLGVIIMLRGYDQAIRASNATALHDTSPRPPS